MLAGWRVIRITWRHLQERPEKLAADLRRLLSRADEAGSREAKEEVGEACLGT